MTNRHLGVPRYLASVLRPWAVFRAGAWCGGLSDPPLGPGKAGQRVMRLLGAYPCIERGAFFCPGNGEKHGQALPVPVAGWARTACAAAEADDLCEGPRLHRPCNRRRARQRPWQNKEPRVRCKPARQKDGRRDSKTAPPAHKIAAGRHSHRIQVESAGTPRKRPTSKAKAQG